MADSVKDFQCSNVFGDVVNTNGAGGKRGETGSDRSNESTPPSISEPRNAFLDAPMRIGRPKSYNSEVARSLRRSGVRFCKCDAGSKMMRDGAMPAFSASADERAKNRRISTMMSTDVPFRLDCA
jgi:hypothetical protein